LQKGGNGKGLRKMKKDLRVTWLYRMKWKPNYRYFPLENGKNEFVVRTVHLLLFILIFLKSSFSILAGKIKMEVYVDVMFNICINGEINSKS
jgi:hypothetical protein